MPTRRAQSGRRLCASASRIVELERPARPPPGTEFTRMTTKLEGPPRVGLLPSVLLQSPADLGHVGADLVARLGEHVGGHLGQAGVAKLFEV